MCKRNKCVDRTAPWGPLGVSACRLTDSYTSTTTISEELSDPHSSLCSRPKCRTLSKARRRLGEHGQIPQWISRDTVQASSFEGLQSVERTGQFGAGKGSTQTGLAILAGRGLRYGTANRTACVIALTKARGSAAVGSGLFAKLFFSSP